jgi:hypothetical protein
MLLRSAGPSGHPVFTADTGDGKAATWESGLAGMLTFFRRLAHAHDGAAGQISFASQIGLGG